MSANPHANGGLLLEDLALPGLPRLRGPGLEAPGTTFAEATRVLGTFLRDVVQTNPDRFRIFGPDETASNRLSAVFEATEPRLGRRDAAGRRATSRPTAA